MEFFVRIFLENGERAAELIPASDKEAVKSLKGKVKKHSYWALKSDDPKCLVHVWYEGDAPPADERAYWDSAIGEEISRYLDNL